jgi:hypothetical protein
MHTSHSGCPRPSAVAAHSPRAPRSLRIVGASSDNARGTRVVVWAVVGLLLVFVYAVEVKRSSSPCAPASDVQLDASAS